MFLPLPSTQTGRCSTLGTNSRCLWHWMPSLRTWGSLSSRKIYSKRVHLSACSHVLTPQPSDLKLKTSSAYHCLGKAEVIGCGSRNAFTNSIHSLERLLMTSTEGYFRNKVVVAWVPRAEELIFSLKTRITRDPKVGTSPQLSDPSSLPLSTVQQKNWFLDLPCRWAVGYKKKGLRPPFSWFPADTPCNLLPWPPWKLFQDTKSNATFPRGVSRNIIAGTSEASLQPSLGTRYGYPENPLRCQDPPRHAAESPGNPYGLSKWDLRKNTVNT